MASLVLKRKDSLAANVARPADSLNRHSGNMWTNFSSLSFIRPQRRNNKRAKATEHFKLSLVALN